MWSSSWTGMSCSIADRTMRAADRLTSEVLNCVDEKSAMNLSAAEFNGAAEKYYRERLRESQLTEALRHLREDIQAAHGHDDTELRDLVRCGLCGRSLAGVCQKRPGGSKYFYYRCNSRCDMTVKPCGLRNVRAEVLERVVWSGVEEIVPSVT